MKIIDTNMYLDGGTIRIETEGEVYYINQAIGAQEQFKGRIYTRYPLHNVTDLLHDVTSDKLYVELIESLAGICYGVFHPPRQHEANTPDDTNFTFYDKGDV